MNLDASIASDHVDVGASFAIVTFWSLGQINNAAQSDSLRTNVPGLALAGWSCKPAGKHNERKEKQIKCRKKKED